MSFTSRDIQKLNTHMETAFAYSKLSRAVRLKVGAVLVKDDRIISVGYNGTASGRPNECEEYVYNIKSSEDIGPVFGPIYEKETKKEVVHAETNVIAFAAKNGVSTEDCIMVITHSPCFECSKLIVQSGIKAVFYGVEYRLNDGLEFLKECGLIVKKLNEVIIDE